ncbi:MAG: carbohydrate ABC transporter permease, partial [Spirochaetaceae bacterium]|nr:carbohydrate ABC transporter permease [Spirochaetaceae bacterium]
MSKSLSAQKTTFKFFVYVVCIILTILSIFPFWTMIVNATRSTYQIQSHAVSIIPSKYLMNNWQILNGKQFNAMQGFINSLIIAIGATVCAVYFSTLTAYSIVVYDWKLKRTFFTFIMAIMMIPSQIVTIGFYQMIYKIHLTNNFLPLIIPAIAAPSTVFFMRQYMIPSLSLEIIESARI